MPTTSDGPTTLVGGAGLAAPPPRKPRRGRCRRRRRRRRPPREPWAAAPWRGGGSAPGRPSSLARLAPMRGRLLRGDASSSSLPSAASVAPAPRRSGSPPPCTSCALRESRSGLGRRRHARPSDDGRGRRRRRRRRRCLGAAVVPSSQRISRSRAHARVQRAARRQLVSRAGAREAAHRRGPARRRLPPRGGRTARATAGRPPPLPLPVVAGAHQADVPPRLARTPIEPRLQREVAADDLHARPAEAREGLLQQRTRPLADGVGRGDAEADAAEHEPRRRRGRVRARPRRGRTGRTG